MKGFGKLLLWHSGLVNACRDVPEPEDEPRNVKNFGDCSYRTDVGVSTTVDASYF
jgi:hypothetical protein